VSAPLQDADQAPAPGRLPGPRRDDFCRQAAPRALTRQLAAGGLFKPWSDKRADARFRERLEAAFAIARAAPVPFDNPLTGRRFARLARGAA